jgi:hypothetical protein
MLRFSKSQWVLGADPELFLQAGDSKKILSAIGKIGGTKKEPKPAEGLAKGFAYQEDNVLVEYNIPPARFPSEWCSNNSTMMSFLGEKVSRELNCRLAIQSSHVMDDDQLADPRAHHFGCDSDFNVWTLEKNPVPKAENPNLRSAGGHIHIGMEMSNMDKIQLGRLLDSTVGVWSVIMDTDPRRRELYGKAGSIRMKPYGLEYRTPSNFWLRSQKSQELMWHYVSTAIDYLRTKNFKDIDENAGDIIRAINTSDKAAAKHLLSKFT